MKKHPCFFLVVLVAVLGLFSETPAQSFTGNIVGTVKNPNGEVIPNAEITITHLQTNKQVQITANGEGYYSSPPLAVGDYRIEVRMTGFRRAVHSGVSLQIQQTALVDFTLEIGAVDETVEVMAQAPILETTSSVLGKVVDNRRILELPLNTRNVYSLIFLTPGVSGGIGNNYNQMNYSVNGARPTMMDTVIDGVTASFPTVNGFTGISVFPSVDAIQEFKVMGATYPAEFGRSLGSVLNVVYKSGTNQFHGSAYEFLRNSVFDANNFFDNRRGAELGSFKRSQFGGHATGPIRRDRTFFMGSFEGLRERRFATTIRTVPTLEQRNGDFSKTLNQAGALIRIFNPFTTRANPSGSGFIRDQFADNRIPQNLIDPVARNILKFYPLPNLPGDPNTGANNFASSGSAQINLNNYDFRIDHRFSDRQTFFARYSHRYTESVPLKAFTEEITIAEGRIIEENKARNFVAEYTHTLSPTMLFTGRMGFARTLFVFSNQGLGFKPSSLGLPGAIDSVVDRQMFPAINVSGVTSLGGGDHRFNAFMSYPFVASVTRSQGKHNWKYGGEVRLIRVNVWEARSAGTFGFNAGMTQGPNPNAASSSAGFGFASFLLGAGAPNNVLIQGWKNVASQSFYYAGYVQDDWRVNTKLTLNLGVRYDFDAPRTERYNRMNFFDLDAPSPLASRVPQFPNLRGGVRFVGVDGNPRHQYFKDANNLAPRLGLAYQLNEKTVIRAGYSHIFGPSNQAAQGTVGPFGFRIEYPWQTTIDGITPFNLLRNPYPEGFRQLPGAADGLLTQVGANLQSVLQDTITPWSQQWNLNIQRQLPWQTSVEIAYVGTRGLHLSRNGEGGLDLNQLHPQHLALGSQLNQQVDNPFFGQGTGGFFNSPRIARGQLLRPFPQFTTLTPLYSSGNSSNYHALQLSFNKRLSNGMLIDGNYTWAKNIEEGLNHQDSYDIRSSRALAGIDIAHRFVVSYLYELPFGKGRRFGNDASGVLNTIIGGWQFNGITTFQTGTPLSISANNTAGLFNPLTRPNTNGNDPKLSGPVHDRLNKYFDTSVYSQPAPFTFGNVGATVNIRNDGIRNFDLSLFKEFRPVERMAVQFRVEALNAFNTPRFGSPNTSVTSNTFGLITAQANAPRQLQFGLKLLW
ncbi:MAG: TonB-dependent receptor [Acidobacteria bacterium]|nr:TonB-dependent receptor [Acidobacteriota bacterium]MCW5969100.1 TonB-dependent receptor [Blastocatellales bacterium]